ncbi:MAG: hypothetical protein LBL19_07895, partial [Spirochaetaceae bacterium]|nr:hypothetical protein [Spirochaetaceae bacterium]
MKHERVSKQDGQDEGAPDRPEKLRWHLAFLQAIQLELIDYKDSLQFTAEAPLTTAPLRLDLLIIKKPPSLVIDKNIA